MRLSIPAVTLGFPAPPPARLPALLPVLLMASLPAVLPAVLPGQAPPGQAPLVRVAESETRADLRIRQQAAERALQAGRTEEAASHLRSAMGLDPTSSTTLRGLLEAAVKAGDEDARTLWATRWWLAMADARGSYKPQKEDKALLPQNDTPLALARAKAAAVAELARYVSKLKNKPPKSLGNGVLARWASDLAWQIMRDAPALQAKYAAAFEKALSAQKPDYKTVLEAVRKTMVSASAAATSGNMEKAKDGAAGANDPTGDKDPTGANDPTRRAQDIAMRAARILTGLAAQAGFKDRKGPPPPSLANLPAAARQARGKLRQKIEAQKGEPWTVAQLRKMSRDDRQKFTRDHSTWANPGIAQSPNKRYVIQTVCGFETLLGVAETVELHHARLATWFGKDPFKARQGTVRIVPEAMGLEAEDAPFWWAGGFQRGDLTTVKFSWGRIGNLGHLLTHELTHRFDGTLYPFQPSWLVEGKAVWTGGSYGRAREKNFVARKLDPRSCSSAFTKGYGGPNKLRKLIEGKIEDYRDNYTAGYALFVYLRFWQENGKPLFADRLENFMSKARAGRSKPLAWFTSQFCDGKEGRPKDFNEFAKKFRSFLEACYKHGWGEGPRWLARLFHLNKLRPDPQRLVMDEPTWIWSRTHAEPWFGQKHAALAGKMLSEVGRTREATAALCWSLQVDGWHPSTGLLLETLLKKHGLHDAAWVTRYELAVRRIGMKIPDNAPMLRALPRTRALVRLLRDKGTERFTAKQTLAARALGEEHNRIGRHVGAAPMTLPKLSDAQTRTKYYPAQDAPERLDLWGLSESELTNYEQRRVKGLWYTTEDGDLHVGRKKPRKDSGLLDRRAHQRHAFVHTNEWQPAGSYVFKTRVHFTTSFVNGALILGYTRRDRNIRLTFRAGDFMYSIGRREAKTETDRVLVTVRGLWPRESIGAIRSERRKPVLFGKPASHFDLEARVAGPMLIVSVNGEYLFTYTTPDLSPIEGAIGVAMGQGAVRLQQPTVQRLDRRNLQPPRQRPPQKRSEALGRPFPGIPLGKHGTIVIWLPREPLIELLEPPVESAFGRLRRMLSDPLRYPQKWVLAVPDNIKGLELKELKEYVAKQAGKDRFTWITHSQSKPFNELAFGLFVDSDGGLRAASPLTSRGRTAGGVQVWARHYRGR